MSAWKGGALMDGKLLEDLAAKMGVFISNLSSDYYVALVGGELQKLNSRDYSLDAWRYCLEYLYHKTYQVQSYDELDATLAQLADETE